jgi:hypothetical protein
VQPGEYRGAGQPTGHRGVLDDVPRDELGIAVPLDRDEVGKEIDQSEPTNTEPEDLPKAAIAETFGSGHEEGYDYSQADPETQIAPRWTSPQELGRDEKG